MNIINGTQVLHPTALTFGPGPEVLSTSTTSASTLTFGPGPEVLSGHHTGFEFGPGPEVIPSVDLVGVSPASAHFAHWTLTALA